MYHIVVYAKLDEDGRLSAIERELEQKSECIHSYLASLDCLHRLVVVLAVGCLSIRCLARMACVKACTLCIVGL